MAHKLHFEDGRAAMFYVREKPWHGLGTEFTFPPKTAEEAIRGANIDWAVEPIPLYAASEGFYAQIPDRYAIVRKDLWGKPGCKLFGIVGSDYRPLQNIDAFRFFDGIVSTGLVSYETGGALGDGERVWVQARVKGDMDVAGDKIERFLLLSNGHDGKTAVDIRFSPIRVVCQNTLSWALQERSPLFHIHHDQRMDKRIEGAEIAIKDILEEYDRIETKFKKFTTIKLAEPSMVEYFTKVFADPKRYTNERDNTYASRLKKVQSTRENARRLADFGEGNQNHRGTVWAAYNGITELVDHEWGYADPTKRLNFLWFGEGERIKIKALEEASNLCRN